MTTLPEAIREHRVSIDCSVKKSLRSCGRELRLTFDELEAAAMEGVWKAWRKLDPTKSQKSYYTYKIRGAIGDYIRQSTRCRIRSHKTGRISEAKIITNGDFDLLVDKHEVEYSDEKEIRQQKIQRLLAFLTKRERVIIYLHYLFGFSKAEICRIFNTSDKTISKIFNKALPKTNAKS